MDIPGRKNIDWIDGLKAFAILAVLLNHSVESFGFLPWFSSSGHWPAFSERIHSIFPSSNNFFADIVIFLGWLGDMGPGVFILLSGLTLTLSALNKKKSTVDFYRQRAKRIFPLYIFIHLLILFFIVFIFRWNTDVFSFKTLFSLAGLRFTDELFFFINPSWWFIWLILQMYLFFPFLLRLMNRRGRTIFFLITLFITLLSRLAGLLDLTWSDSSYYWMTGIFGGTRLLEFTSGMLIGSLMHENHHKFSLFLENKIKVFLFSLLIYACGFLCSLSYAGILISNTLITIGLTGVFYSIYHLLCSSHSVLRKAVAWMGRNSFSVFLLHQPFMMHASYVFEKDQLLIVLILIICASFIAGYYIEKTVNAATPFILTNLEKIRNLTGSKVTGWHIFILILILAIYSFFTPFISHDSTVLKFIHIIIQLLLLGLIFVFRENQKFRTDILISRFFDASFLVTAVFMFLTVNWQPLYWLVLLLSLMLIFLSSRLNYFLSLALTFLLIFTGILFCETNLRKNKPLEVLQWGELPALQPDKKTGYSLIPSRETHLKYNNYDYFVRTNSLGLASPEVDMAKTPDEFRIFIIGDAFTMPEGMEYESAYPFLLEKKLRQSFPERKISVINGGVTGFGPNEFLAQLEKYADTIKPDLVINQFFVNEFEEVNIELGGRNAGIGFDLKKSARQYYFGNTQVPVHYVRKFYGSFNHEDRSFNYRKSLISFYEKNSHFYADSILEKIDRYFDKINELCTEKNCKLLIMFVPGQIVVSDPGYISYFPSWVDLSDTSLYSPDKPNRIIEKMCSSKNIPFTDVTEPLKKHKPQPVYFTGSWHWNEEGHRVAAGMLEDAMKKMINFKDYSKTENLE